jgi:hypothetical protein
MEEEGKERREEKTYPSSMARAHNPNSPTSFLNSITRHLLLLFVYISKEESNEA